VLIIVLTGLRDWVIVVATEDFRARCPMQSALAAGLNKIIRREQLYASATPSGVEADSILTKE